MKTIPYNQYLLQNKVFFGLIDKFDYESFGLPLTTRTNQKAPGGVLCLHGMAPGILFGILHAFKEPQQIGGYSVYITGTNFQKTVRHS